MKSVQWLTEIEVVEREYKGYHAQTGWTEAVVKSRLRVDALNHGMMLRGLRHLIQVLAFRHAGF